MKTTPHHAPDRCLRESFDAVARFAETWRMKDDDPLDFMAFERRLMAEMDALKRELLRTALENQNVDAPRVVIDGVEHRRVLHGKTTVTTRAGPVQVSHTLYRRRGASTTGTVSGLARRVGLVEGFTPDAAGLAMFVVTELVPEKAAELFERVGGMTPSKSTLDRLPKRLAEEWEGARGELEAALREGLVVPELATTLAVSLDGVMAPMKDGGRADKRRATASRGKLTKGPAGYREVGVGTLTFCNELGLAEGAIRMARHPEANKACLKRMLRAEVDHALAQVPELRLVKLADGAEDNWTFLRDELPPGVEIIDFWHAAQHLNAALGAAYGEGSTTARRRFEDLRWVLRDERDGVTKVIRSLDYLAKKHPRQELIRVALGYFRKHRKRMRYRDYTDEGLPIGSGMVEAACRTLVAQRLKRSGMAWTDDGAQAILTPRAWAQSKRFDEAWALLAARYHSDIQLITPVDEHPAPSNVIPFPRPKVSG